MLWMLPIGLALLILGAWRYRRRACLARHHARLRELQREFHVR